MSELRLCNFLSLRGGVAQLGEHLICIQKVAGSIPVASTNSNLT